MTTPLLQPNRVRVPPLPASTAPFRFPLLASIAPVVVSVALFMVTGSPFMLMFAALGPLTAAASFADSRLGARRETRRERERFLAEAAMTAEAVRERHRLERVERAELAPGAQALLGRRGADPYRWRAASAGSVTVALGTGSIPSALELERAPAGTTVPADLEGALTELELLALTLHDAPVAVDASLGIGVVGPHSLAIAFARSLVVQVGWALTPGTVTCVWSGDASELWLDALPHRTARTTSRDDFTVAFKADDGTVLIATAPTPAQLPGACRVVVRLGGDGAGEVVQHPDREERRRFRPAFVSREQAAAWAERVSRDAATEGLVSDEAALPATVPLSSLDRAGGPGLAARFAVGADGALDVDLVRDGPHAIVGGTTGSGKSELLSSWVVAMAAAHSPERVSFLLVDFKGGAAFAPLAALPHTVGIVTDLDEAGAARALASLRAELRHRERELARAGVADIAQAPSLPRLVIVVDEFAAMMAIDPELHALFADLAARGRSLGVHLVLCTQRPAGVVRDAVLANADLRISLRVNNRADSDAVTGSPAAAELPALPRGRAVMRLAGHGVQTVQIALTAPEDVAATAARWRDSRPPRRPWCEPLPAVVLPAELSESDGVPFGLLDLPDEQRRATAEYLPARDGHVLVLGDHGSGKSTLLRALATHPGARWLPSRPAAAWDTVGDLLALLERNVDSTGAEVLVFADDLDALLARFPDDHRGAFLEQLGRVLREGSAHGIRVVVAAQRISADLQTVCSVIPSRLLLRLASREEFVLAGGERGAWSPRLPPGGGTWRGHRVQVVLIDAPRAADPPAREAALGERPLALVTPRAGSLATAFREAGYAPVTLGAQDAAVAPRDLVVGAGRAVLLGDAEEWQSRWGALAALRPVADILFDGCSVADYRALTRSRTLPPPLEPGQCWWWAHDGEVRRARLPLP